MNAGIVFRYFKKSKFGFIKTLDEKVFFHFSEKKDMITKGDWVTFDLSKNKQGKIAINIRLLKEDEQTLKNLYLSESNSLYKWVAVKHNSYYYAIEFKKYISQIERTENRELRQKKFLEDQRNFINNIVEYYSSGQVLKDLKVELTVEYWTAGGRDFTSKGEDYFKEAINYKPELPEIPFEIGKFCSSLQLNYHWNNDIIIEFRDDYINDLLKYKKFVSRNIKPKVELTELNEVLVDLRNNFKMKYSKSEHLKSLDKYLNKAYPYKSEENPPRIFANMVDGKVEEFVHNNLKKDEIFGTCQREIDEEFEIGFF